MTTNKNVTQNGDRSEGNGLSQSHQIVSLHSCKYEKTKNRHTRDESRFQKSF